MKTEFRIQNSGFRIQKTEGGRQKPELVGRMLHARMAFLLTCSLRPLACHLEPESWNLNPES